MKVLARLSQCLIFCRLAIPLVISAVIASPCPWHQGASETLRSTD